jgi:hypothetical protein
MQNSNKKRDAAIFAAFFCSKNRICYNGPGLKIKLHPVKSGEAGAPRAI